MDQKWKTYEEVAADLLNQFAAEFGLSRVEGKQTVEGQRSGTQWEIDAKGVSEGNQGFIIVECRRYTTSKLSQEKVGALAYRITDTGAEGGIMVSPLGLQEGARKIAGAENIVEVRLAPNSTPHDFTMQFLNKVMIGISDSATFSDSVKVEITRPCSECGKTFTVKENERTCPDCSLTSTP
jgi:hypothetical protein